MTNQAAPTSLRVGASRIGFPLLVLIVLIAGCGGGERIIETREVAPFERLEIAGVDVKVVEGDGRHVRVYAGENVIDRVETESNGGVLRIDVRDRGIVIGSDPLGDAQVEVTAAALEGIEVDGSGDVLLEDLDSQALELELQGAADLEAKGTVERLTATIQGAGDADLSELSVRTATVQARGAADVELNVSEQLNVSVQGAGDVTYRGDPVVESDIEGAGDLRRIGP
jgi:Putative auto-transporter adhesin, head GIN domain